MNNKRGIALIRQKRDMSLVVMNWLAWSVYFLISFTYLSVNDVAGNDILVQACVIYGSYALTFLFVGLEGMSYKWETRIKSFRSYSALIITLLLAFPVRVLLHGMTGYWAYVKRECKRISKLETTRKKERP